MRRSYLIAVLFCALAVLIAVFLFRSEDGIKGGDFKIKPGKSVTKVILQKADSKVVLEMKNGEWTVNGKEKARKPAIAFLLSTLEEMKPRSSVSQQLFDDLAQRNTFGPVTVKAFSGRRKITSFLVYHFNEKDYSSVVRKDSRSKPYLVSLPGYDFDPGLVFTTEADYWKPFTIFEIMPSGISEVKMDYPGDTSRSFTITCEEGRVLLKEATAFDTVSARRYLSYFINVPFESLATGINQQEESAITTSTPYFCLSMTTISGKKYLLKGWRRFTVKDGTRVADTDRIWGKLDDGRLFVMRYLDIDPLLRKRSYFLNGK